MIEAIIYDFDGVIVDSEHLHYEAFLKIFNEMEIDFDYASYVERYIGYDDRDGFPAIAKDHGVTITAEMLPDLIARKAVVFEELVRAGIPACPGVLDLIQSTAQHYPIAIASGALRSDIEAILPHLGDGNIKQLFKHIVTADDVERSKPDPATYLLAAEKMGFAPENCLAIEDTPTGLTSATNAGLKTIAVASTNPVEALTPIADHTVESLTELNVEQIKAWFD